VERGGPRPVAWTAAGGSWWRLGLVASRNGVAILGVFFLGWSATNLLVLYFADFLAGLGAIMAAYAFQFTGVADADGLWDHVYGFLSALLAGLFLVAIFAVPFGMPLVFVFASAGSWPDPRESHGLVQGIGWIALTALLETVRRYVQMREGPAGEQRAKLAATILITRWVLVMVVTYSGVLLFGRAAPYLLVGLYAVASVWSELDPDRFARIFPERAASRGSREGRRGAG
jgi:hypothetical protein